MHRSTPADTLHRAFSGGGMRSIIDKVDDNHMMQEMAGNFMKGETRKAIEAAQNYGFTSVVRAATKGKDGQIEECAEGFMSMIGGSHSFPICTVMDDRRYRPWGLKEGESGQYDDLGQMTLLRRTGLYLLSLDGPDDSQKQQSGGGPSVTPHDGSGGQQQNVERMVSLRHVQKKKQERPSDEEGADQTNRKDHKHEGESVNMEVRVTKGRIEFRDGDTVVGYYDKQAKRWSFTGEMRLGADDASHPVYGVNGGVGMTTEPNGNGAVLVKAPKPGPPTSQDTEP